MPAVPLPIAANLLPTFRFRNGWRWRGLIDDNHGYYCCCEDQTEYDKGGFISRTLWFARHLCTFFYDVKYNNDGTVKEIEPNHPAAPKKVLKYIVRDLDRVPFPTQMLVPNTEIVHDRMFLEIFRGCPRGCRFCQAGQLYRPVREKLPNTLVQNALEMTRSSGYDELGLLSLSTSDYGCLGPLTDNLLELLEPKQVSLSLPSLRLDSFSMDLMERVSRGRRSGLTFALKLGRSACEMSSTKVLLKKIF